MDLSRHQSFLIGNYAPPAIEIVKGLGSKLWDKEGKEYLDFTSGIAVTNLGHSHPIWVRKVQQQTAQLAHCSNLFSIPEQVRLAERMIQKIGRGKCCSATVGQKPMKHSLNSPASMGMEPDDIPKRKILVAKNGFHGRTIGALSATESPKYRKGFEPLLNDFVFCRLNDTSDFESNIDEKHVPCSSNQSRRRRTACINR